VTLNGEIRWVRLNEGRRWWMREGERRIRGGKNTREGILFWGEHHFSEERTVLLVWGWSSLLEDGTIGFFLRNWLEFGGLRQGAHVARSFGLRGPGILTESWS
jgi:hypothetical protein